MWPINWREAVNDRVGVFLKEHAVTYIAAILELSRATLYQRLKLVRGKVISKPARKGIAHVKAKA